MAPTYTLELFLGTAVIEADRTARSFAQTNSHRHGSARPRTGGQFRFRDWVMFDLQFLQTPGKWFSKRSRKHGIFIDEEHSEECSI
ncbi:hypothetical protein LB506_007702 [Fusarium annulatum]|nr:hypothetical protein LB506_007702 [Fusarium annulatum]